MSYRYGFESEDLYVEQQTQRVPDDGQYHIVYRGELVEKHANLKRALARLQQLRHSISLGEDIVAASDPRANALQAEAVHRFMSQSASEKRANRTRKGGKGRA